MTATARFILEDLPIGAQISQRIENIKAQKLTYNDFNSFRLLLNGFENFAPNERLSNEMQRTQINQRIAAMLAGLEKLENIIKENNLTTENDLTKTHEGLQPDEKSLEQTESQTLKAKPQSKESKEQVERTGRTLFDLESLELEPQVPPTQALIHPQAIQDAALQGESLDGVEALQEEALQEFENAQEIAMLQEIAAPQEDPSRVRFENFLAGLEELQDSNDLEKISEAIREADYLIEDAKNLLGDELELVMESKNALLEIRETLAESEIQKNDLLENESDESEQNVIFADKHFIDISQNNSRNESQDEPKITKKDEEEWTTCYGKKDGGQEHFWRFDEKNKTLYFKEYKNSPRFETYTLSDKGWLLKTDFNGEKREGVGGTCVSIGRIGHINVTAIVYEGNVGEFDRYKQDLFEKGVPVNNIFTEEEFLKVYEKYEEEYKKKNTRKKRR